MMNIKDALENMKGKCVDIYTKHCLFDDQHIKSENFIPITDIGFGFKYRNQNIYMKHNEVEIYDIKEDRLIISGNGFTIMVVKKA